MSNSRTDQGATLVRIVATVFAVVGVILLAVCALVIALSAQGAEARSASATGTVIGLDEEVERTTRNGQWRESYTYCPIIKYTVDGKPLQFRSGICSGVSDTQIGSTVALRYAPDNPTDVSIDSWTARWLAPVIVGGMGVLFTAVGGVLFVVWRRRSAATGS